MVADAKILTDTSDWSRSLNTSKEIAQHVQYQQCVTQACEGIPDLRG